MDEAEHDDQVLMRIIATLLALADLALRASFAPDPVRHYVFALLQHAEMVARAHALEAGVSALAPVRARHGGNDAAELASLALRLRTLALAMWIACARNATAFVMPVHSWLPSPEDRVNAPATDAVRALKAPDSS